MPAALYGFELFTNSSLRLRRSALTQTFLCCGRAVSLLACSPRTDKRADSESYAGKPSEPTKQSDSRRYLQKGAHLVCWRIVHDGDLQSVRSVRRELKNRERIEMKTIMKLKKRLNGVSVRSLVNGRNKLNWALAAMVALVTIWCGLRLPARSALARSALIVASFNSDRAWARLPCAWRTLAS